MPAIGLARHPAVRPSGRAARAGLVVLVALASLLVAGRLQAPPAVRTIAVGRVPMAVVVDARTRRVFVANYGAASVTMLDATSGAVLATVAVAPYPSALAVATTARRVFAVSDHVALDDTGRISVLDATCGRRLRIVAVGRGVHLLAVHERTGCVFITNGGDASVSMLDVHSGRVLRTLPLDLVPTAMAMDERTGRVLLAGVSLDQGSLAGLSLLDARSGTVLRTVPMGTLASAIAVDGSRRPGH